jgi:hypothetical protein
MIKGYAYSLNLLIILDTRHLMKIVIITLTLD